MKSIILICTLICSFSIAQAQDFYSENEVLLGADQLERVRSNALKELDAHPNSIEATYFLAMVAINRTAKADPARIYAKNRYAERFQDLYREQAKSARLMYGDQIMVADTRFVRMFYFLGLQYHSHQEYAKAAEWLNLAKIGFEDNLDFNFITGTSYYAIKNYENAKKYFLEVLKINPDHGDTIYNMACLNAIANDPDEAVKWLGKAISLDRKYKKLAMNDSDFNNIRKAESYQKLMDK